MAGLLESLRSTYRDPLVLTYDKEGHPRYWFLYLDLSEIFFEETLLGLRSEACRVRENSPSRLVLSGFLNNDQRFMVSLSDTLDVTLAFSSRPLSRHGEPFPAFLELEHK